MDGSPKRSHTFKREFCMVAKYLRDKLAGPQKRGPVGVLVLVVDAEIKEVGGI